MRNSNSQIQAEFRRGEMRLVGPNCLGMMNPASGLNATFAQDIVAARQCGVSQPERGAADGDSGLELQEQVGFSAIVSTGSMLDVSWGDLISLLRR